MSRLPSLSSLRTFEAVVRHGNFSKAGRELNVTHSAVSQQVHKLERFLALKLVYRTGSGIELTEVGRQLGDKLSKAFFDMQRAIADAQCLELQRPISVNMTSMLSAEWLGPRLSEFRQSFPNINLVINTRTGAVDLTAGTIDHAIKYGTGEWPDFQSQLFIRTSYVIVASPAIMSGRISCEREELVKMPWIQELDTTEVQDWLAKHDVPGRENVSISYLPGNMVLQAVRNGIGIAATSRICVEDDIENGDLQVLFEEGADNEHLGYYFISRTSLRESYINHFIEWMKTIHKRDQLSRGERK